MASHRWGARGASVAAVAGALLAGAAWGQQFQPEQVSVAPAITAKNRVYVLDIAINHIADGKLHIVDGDSLRYLGLIGTGFTGQTILSPDGKEIIVATGYLSRGQRGERADIVEVWDADTLQFKYEIPIPDKRAMALNYEGLLRLSSTGRWLFVQNATPATSVTLVDMQAKQALDDISMPGCFGIYPSQTNPNRFASLCGDGTIATVTLDDSGNVASRDTTQKVFDPDSDAWFHLRRASRRHLLLCELQGQPHCGRRVRRHCESDRHLAAGHGADAKKKWRPGGYQPLAIQGNRIYVAVHPNGAEGSHKNPAAEIWAFDLTTKKRVARMKGHNAIALEASADGSKLYAIDPVKLALVVYDNLGAKPKIRSLQVGETAVQLVAP